MQVQAMIRSHPDEQGEADAVLIRCIELCYECAQTCISCADACLAEETVRELTQCIRLNLDCADVCTATGVVGSRRTGSNELVLASLLETCMEACRLCGDECDRHAQQHDHCAICAETCQRCEIACRNAVETVRPTLQ